MKLPYRILYIAQTLGFGGAEKVILDLATHINKKRFEPVVFSHVRGLMEENFLKAGIDLEIIEKTRPLDFLFLIKMCRTIKQKKIDLIHSHGVTATVYGGIAAKFFRIPLMITVHGRSTYSVRVGVKGLQFAQKFGANIVTVSNQLKYELTRDIGLNEEKITTIYNGIDADKLLKSDEQLTCAIKKELSIDSYPVVGSVGSLREVKGHRYLIQALPRILKKYPNIKLIFVGDGELKDDLMNISEKLNVSKNILFLGHRRDVPQLMSVFDLVVQPSLTEGISIVILEAMASSKAIIATDVGGNSTLVENNNSGILIPPRDSEKLADAIINLLGDGKKRMLLGETAFKRVKERFSIYQTVSEYEKLYMGLIV